MILLGITAAESQKGRVQQKSCKLYILPFSRSWQNHNLLCLPSPSPFAPPYYFRKMLHGITIFLLHGITMQIGGKLYGNWDQAKHDNQRTTRAAKNDNQ